MTNDVTTTTNGTMVSLPDSGPDPFAAFASSQGVIRGSFLKFDGNTGDFEVGVRDAAKDLPHGTLLACNLTSIKRGWICWKSNEVVEEIMVGLFDGVPPEKGDLTDHGPYAKYPDGTEDGWSEQVSIEFREKTTGELYTFKAMSKSGRSSIARVADDYSKVFKQKRDQFPLIEISANAFEPKLPKNPDGTPGKKIGKKYAPVFKIKAWISGAEFNHLLDLNGGEGESQEDDSDDQSNYEDEATPGEGSTEVGGARRARRI